jgi:effector-binding domain-containing protein
MKLIKIVGISLVLLAAAFFIISGSIDSTLRVETELRIQSDPRSIYNRVGILKQLKLWDSVYAEKGDMKYKYSRASAGTGAWMKYKSSDLGVGKVEVETAKRFTHVKTKVQKNGDPFPETNSFVIGVGDDSISVNVKWRWSKEIPFMQRIPAYLGRSGVEQSLVDRLASLKELCEMEFEANPDDPYNIHIQPKTETPILFVIDSVHISGLYGRLDSLFTGIRTVAAEKEVSIEGNPHIIWFRYDPAGTCIFEVAYKTDGIMQDTTTGVVSGYLPEGQVVQAEFTGNFRKSYIIYEKIEEYIETFGFEQIAAPWEEYLVAPFDEPDTAKWKMTINFPVM